MRRNRLTSVLAYHRFHLVPSESVVKIFLNSLIQPKDNTFIQYLYLWFFNQPLVRSRLKLRLQRGFRSNDSHFDFIVKHEGEHRGMFMIKYSFHNDVSGLMQPYSTLNPPGQPFSNDTSCPFPISTASCAFTTSGEIRPVTTLTKSAGWLYRSRGAMQVRRFRILSLSFASEVMRDGFSFPWLVTYLSARWWDTFAISWTIQLQVSVLYVHSFMVSGFGLCLWCRLEHFRNARRLSLSRCQTPRKTKQWIWQRWSTTANLSAVIHLRTGFFSMCFYITVYNRPVNFSLKMFCSSINVLIAYKL